MEGGECLAVDRGCDRGCDGRHEVVIDGIGGLEFDRGCSRRLDRVICGIRGLIA